MTKEKTIERFFAVRIGDPKHDTCYYMTRPCSHTPELFLTRLTARHAIEKYKPECPTIVRVTISD